MSSIASLVACLLVLAWRDVAAIEEEILAQTSGISNHRQPRHLASKLCLKLGLCGGGGYQGGFQGGYGGSQGYPAINIGLSQSQASSSAGGGGYGSGYFPHNYQYNGHPGYNNGYPGGYNNGYPGYNRPGYFGNGFGSYNNQFNGNYYGGRPQGGGYGFQGPFGNFYDEGSSDVKPVYENEDDYSRSAKSKN